RAGARLAAAPLGVRPATTADPVLPGGADHDRPVHLAFLFQLRSALAVVEARHDLDHVAGADRLAGAIALGPVVDDEGAHPHLLSGDTAAREGRRVERPEPPAPLPRRAGEGGGARKVPRTSDAGSVDVAVAGVAAHAAAGQVLRLDRRDLVV